MFKYLFEIKNRLSLLFVNWAFVVAISYCYKEVLLFSIILNSDRFYFIFTNVTEIFSVYLTIISFISVQVILWYLFYHILIFIVPALFKTEFKLVNFFFKILTFFLFFSFLLSNYILIPLTWQFFLSFKPLFFAKSVHFEARLSEYLTFYTTVYYFCLIYCQIFSVLVFFLSDVYFKNSLIKIKKFRKVYYYIFVIFATTVSPP